MDTFSALLDFVMRILWSPVNFPHKVQWRGALMFSLIYAWTNGWVNTWDAGDLRRHLVHYDVSVMSIQLWGGTWLTLLKNLETLAWNDLYEHVLLFFFVKRFILPDNLRVQPIILYRCMPTFQERSWKYIIILISILHWIEPGHCQMTWWLGSRCRFRYNVCCIVHNKRFFADAAMFSSQCSLIDATVILKVWFPYLI